MSHSTRLRATALALSSALLLVTGCGSESSANDPANVTLGWVPKDDEQTGVGFALPAPVTGPEAQRRPGEETAVASRAYAARAGELTLSLQFLSTPESPGSLAEELPVQRMPYVVIDQIRAQGGYEVDVLSNERADDLQQPTYDARLRASSGEEDAVWAMRSRAFEDFVLVTQVVGFPADGISPEFEQRIETAFERLNDTIVIPDSLE